jgi:hypothetical protein
MPRSLKRWPATSSIWRGSVALPTCRPTFAAKGTAIPLVQREEDARFTSKFITADPNIKTLADTRGKVFAFGSPSSTSGHLMPRYFLMEEGINADSDFKNVAFSGAHDATVAFVASGKADAGVLNASVWAKLVEEKKVDEKVRVIATTPPYFDYNWTVRGDLDPAADQEADRRFPQARRRQPGARRNPGSAAGHEVHPDEEGELRRHRKGGAGGWLAEVGRLFPLHDVAADARQRLCRAVRDIALLPCRPANAWPSIGPSRSRQDDASAC